MSNLTLNAQKTDSVAQALRDARHDTSIIKNSIFLGELIFTSDPDSSQALWLKAVIAAEKAIPLHNGDSSLTRYLNMMLAAALNDLGLVYERKGDVNKALDCHFKSLKVKEQLKDKVGIAYSCNNLGYIMKSRGDIQKALEYYKRSVQNYREINDRKGMANVLNNIAVLYISQGEEEQGMKYLEESLDIKEKLGDKEGMSNSWNNIGSMLMKRGKFDEAKKCFDKAKGLAMEIGDQHGLARSINSLADLHRNKKETDKALDLYAQALAIMIEMSDVRSLANIQISMSNCYLDKRDYIMARKHAEKAMELSRKLKYPALIKGSARVLYEVDKLTGNFSSALENFELYIKMSDSINNEESRKASIRSQLKFEYERQSAADSVSRAKEAQIKNVEIQKQKTEIRAKKTQQYVLLAGLFVVGLFSLFMYNRYKLTIRQKQIIEEQKHEVEKQKSLVDVKQKEILDSIRYARRIQLAQMPTEGKVTTSIKRLRS